LSDIHGQIDEPVLNKLPKSDLIIIAGDICPDFKWRPDYEEQAHWLNRDFRNWLERQKASVVATWGNHDFIGEHPEMVPTLPWTLLVDEATVVNGLKIWGSPWCLKFYDWAFMKNEAGLMKVYKAIPDDVHILVSHCPPNNYCDRTIEGDLTGSTALLNTIQRTHPLVTVCGHIHEARGVGLVWDSTVLNASCVDERYQMRAEPWVMVDL
jgi:Icc-related predicted phosphoesterase